MTKVIFFDFWGTLAENGVRSPVKFAKSILRLQEMDFSEYIVTFEEAFMTSNYETLEDGFKEVLQKIGEKHPGSEIDERYNRRSVKQSQTKRVIDKHRHKWKVG